MRSLALSLTRVFITGRIPRHHFHILEESDVTQTERRQQQQSYNSTESAFFSKEEVANPLIRACLVDDFDIIQLLLEFGFVVWDPERVVALEKSPLVNRKEDEWRMSSTWTRGDDDGQLEDPVKGDDDENNHVDASQWMLKTEEPEYEIDSRFYPYHPWHPTRWFASYACQRALCSSSYINLTETETTMRCLELAGRFKRRAHSDPDHGEAYHSLTELCVGYATGLLDVCRDDDDDDGDGDDPEEAFDEMDAIVGITFGGNAARSPQIETAMDDKQMAFYTHEKCYKYIERWEAVFEVFLLALL